MSAQNRSTEALFMALANAEEATRASRELARIHPRKAALNLIELQAALNLVNDIAKQLGDTAIGYARALNALRPHHTFSDGALAYAAARDLHSLGTRLRRGIPVGDSLAAITALDTALNDPRRQRGTGKSST